MIYKVVVTDAEGTVLLDEQAEIGDDVSNLTEAREALIEVASLAKHGII